MHRRTKVVTTLGLTAALSFSIAGCSYEEPKEAEESPSLVLAAPWQEAEVTWKEDGDVFGIVALPENIAYGVKKTGSDEFVMRVPQGDVVARVGQPEGWASDDYSMTVEPVYRGDNMYVTVVQRDHDSTVDLRIVATGFDEQGKQLFRKELKSDAKGELPKFDPVTGAVLPQQDPDHQSGGFGSYTDDFSMIFGLIDGVKITRRTVAPDVQTMKAYLSGPGWEREVPVASGIEPAGAYIRVLAELGVNVAETSPFNKGEDYCRLLDPHTGEVVAADSPLGTSCSFFQSPFSSDNALLSRSTEGSEKANKLLGVLLPKSGKSRSFSGEPRFLPSSVDPDGTIYGELVTSTGLAAASTSIDSKDEPVALDNVDRVPVAITNSGIAAFPVDGLGSIEGRMLFAVKPTDKK